jgi:hypothetical protein
MLKTAVAVVIAAAFAVSSHTASADELSAIADGDGWDLALYAAGDPEAPGNLPGGGLAFSTRPASGWPSASLAVDYATEGAPATEGSGLGLRASLDLLEPGGELLGAEPSLRLNYRMAPGFDPVGGNDDAMQIIALRAGLRW